MTGFRGNKETFKNLQLLNLEVQIYSHLLHTINRRQSASFPPVNILFLAPELLPSLQGYEPPPQPKNLSGR